MPLGRTKKDKTPDNFIRMHTFNQDAIMVGDGKMVSLLFADGSEQDLGEALTFRPEIITDLGGFSKIKGRKFSFTDPDTAGAQVDKETVTTQGCQAAYSGAEWADLEVRRNSSQSHRGFRFATGG
jgi:hypothetical protein